MKLLKKLMPLATVAATAVCVAPMVTSCTKTLFTVNDLTWLPDKHAAVSDGLTLEEAKKEYFKDGLKILAQDLAYITVYAANEELEKLKATATITKSTFNLQIQDTAIQEKTVTISGEEVAGYLISATLNQQEHLEYELKTPMQGAKKESHIIDRTAHMEVKNAFLVWTNQYNMWISDVNLLKDASNNWSMLEKETEKDKMTLEYENGSFATQTKTEDDGDYYSCKAGNPDQLDAMPIYSYVFKDVKLKKTK